MNPVYHTPLRVFRQLPNWQTPKKRKTSPQFQPSLAVSNDLTRKAARKRRKRSCRTRQRRLKPRQKTLTSFSCRMRTVWASCWMSLSMNCKKSSLEASQTRNRLLHPKRKPQRLSERGHLRLRGEGPHPLYQKIRLLL